MRLTSNNISLELSFLKCRWRSLSESEFLEFIYVWHLIYIYWYAIDCYWSVLDLNIDGHAWGYFIYLLVTFHLAFFKSQLHISQVESFPLCMYYWKMNFVKNKSVWKLLRHNIKAYRIINFLPQTVQLMIHAKDGAIQMCS